MLDGTIKIKIYFHIAIVSTILHGYKKYAGILKSTLKQITLLLLAEPEICLLLKK